MKVNLKRRFVTKPEILRIMLIEASLVLAISIALAAFAGSISLIWLMFFPIRAALLPLFCRIYKRCDGYFALFEICKTDLHFDILSKNQSALCYFENLHLGARKSANAFFGSLSTKPAKDKENALKLYADVALICEYLSQIGLFRVFSASLILDFKYRSFILCVAIFTVLLRNIGSAKSAIFSFITLPQRAAVIFDAIIRELLKLWLSKTSFYLIIKKSQPAYFHFDRFVRISAYFWSYCFSIAMVFSKNKILAICGVMFMLSPYCLICHAAQSA